jgi:hypothetical protein
LLKEIGDSENQSGNQLLEKDRTTLALALFVILVGAIASLSIWIRLLAAAFSVFLLFWGRDSEGTEAMVSRIPIAGPFLLRGLHQLDLIISPRDQDYEEHLREVITAYGPRYRQSLRKLLQTRLASQIPDGHWLKFSKDGLVEHPHSGPGPIKTELRDPIRRILQSLDDRDLDA